MLYDVRAVQYLPKNLAMTEFISVFFLFIWMVLNSVEPKIVDDFLSLKATAPWWPLKQSNQNWTHS